MEIIIISVLAILTGIAAFMLFNRQQQTQKSLQDTLVEKGKVETALSGIQSQLKQSNEENSTLRERVNQLNTQAATAASQLQHLREQLATQKEEMIQLNDRFKSEFENIANKLLEEKSVRFTEQNKTKLGELLLPLSEKIKGFEEKVDSTNKEGIERNSKLIEQIEQLRKMNHEMSEEARNLTKALKGDTKTQGNWGEVILERILEKSGLKRGFEYTVQESTTNEEGRRLQPDVIIQLPEDKMLIIDSKVSLIAYERFVSAETDTDRQAALKLHIHSIRQHIKGLSNKNYHQLYGGKSPDFVLMFIPIEPAFSLAIMNDDVLYNDAFDQNIVLVSTSTLLATLRTISSIWKQEYQNRNAVEIAKSAGDMYDKLVAFVEDLQAVGSRIEQTSKAYDAAMNKLSTGRGNLIGRAERMKKLGVGTAKSLPDKLMQDEEE